MNDTTPNARQPFPWWIVGGAFLLAAAYLPTLLAPFDFVDDGNLVYPTRGLSATGHVALWWEKVVANVEHLGPFRPSLWVHWEIFANLFDGDPLLWRLHRLLWCTASAGLFLWFLRDLKVAPVAALLAGAVGMWNPYRNEIWLSLTLAEGVAMPYAILALIAARQAARSPRPLRWELLSAACLLVTLGCKNTFAALIPAQVILRMWPDGLSLREAWKRNGFRSALLAIPLAMPVAHFIYFKLNWHPGQYHTTGLTGGQAFRLLASLKGAVSLDYLGVGLALAALGVYFGRRVSLAQHAVENKSSERATPGLSGELRPALVAGVLLLVGGYAVYLPVDIISGRYTMPAAWGLDVLIGALFTALLAVPRTAWSRAAWVGVAAGLTAVMISIVGKQEKFTARANAIWDAVHYVEANAPPGARVAWIDGDAKKGELDTEEGIHFAWHLKHRGRGDVLVGLFDQSGRLVPRVELPPLEGTPDFRIGVSPSAREWSPEQSFDRTFWMGRRHFAFQLERRVPSGRVRTDPVLMDLLKREMIGTTEASAHAAPGGLGAFFTDPAVPASPSR